VDSNPVSLLVFLASLAFTFWLAWYARTVSRAHQDDDLAGRSLNRWLIGLSAGATANSGFIVTGAVGLGYLYGVQWLLLPLSWLIGDLVFWRLFPQRINNFGRKNNAVTLTEILRSGLSNGWSRAISIVSAIVIIIGLGGYTAAQWIAGQKFLLGAFGIPSLFALLLFASLIILYSSIGGFRGSVYVDTFQAILRLVGTLMVVITSTYLVATESAPFLENIRAVDPAFFNPFPDASIASAVGFILGWASAALGFGLGQPQVVNRYLAGSSPEETKKARWIYIGYVQLTWITMTGVGILLRGLMPGLEDPEAGLSIFVQTHLFAVASGIIIADIFGVIASTANSLLIALAQSVKHDILSHIPLRKAHPRNLTVIIVIAGAATMAIASVLTGSVASLAITAISFVAAGIAGPMIIKLMNWRHTGASLTIAMIIGIAVSMLWSGFGLSSTLNEAAIGISVSITLNYLMARIKKPHKSTIPISAQDYSN